jgi:DNA-binding response OmpR family regulator
MQGRSSGGQLTRSEPLVSPQEDNCRSRLISRRRNRDVVHASARVRVGSFELDLRSGELRSVGADAATDRVILREQPFQVLRMLIERDGKIVTRDEIKKRLWPNDTIVDFDHSINVAIGVLRRAMGDSAANPRYIETLARPSSGWNRHLRPPGRVMRTRRHLSGI